jgi:hypothetical protein
VTENTRHRPPTEHPALQLSLFTPTLHLVLCDGKRAVERGWQLRMPAAEALDRHVHRGGDLGYIPASVEGVVIDLDTGPNAAPVVQLLGEPVETTVSMGDGRHLLYLAPSGYVPATGTGKGKFRLGEAGGDWIHHGSYAVETRTGWGQLAALDTLVQCGREDHVVPVTAAGSRIRSWGLYGDGPLYEGIRAVGLLYRMNVEAGRLLATGRFEGEPHMLKLARRLDMAYCRPRLPWREVERYGLSVSRYWRRRARDGDSPAWLAKQSRRGRRSGVVRRKKQAIRWSKAFPMFDDGMSAIEVAAALGVHRATALRDFAVWQIGVSEHESRCVAGLIQSGEGVILF